MCSEATIIIIIIILIGQGPVSAWQVRCIVRCILRRRLRVTSKYIIEDATCFRSQTKSFQDVRNYASIVPGGRNDEKSEESLR